MVPFTEYRRAAASCATYQIGMAHDAIGCFCFLLNSRLQWPVSWCDTTGLPLPGAVVDDQRHG